MNLSAAFGKSFPSLHFSGANPGQRMTIEEELETHIIEVRPRFGRPRKDGGTQDEAAEEAQVFDPESAEGKIALQYLPRNVELILEHFGMGSIFWPSLQDLANAFHGLETRERVRQIIQKYYTLRLPSAPLATAAAAAELLLSEPVWMESAFLSALRDAGLTRSIDHAVSLIDYLQTQGLAEGYAVYRPDFGKATRNSYFDHRDRILTTADRAALLKKHLERARAITGVNGLCRLSHVDADMTPENREILKLALRAHRNAWVADHEGDLWYTFEDRENRLVNYAEKIFSLVKVCEIRILAELMANALTARTSNVGEYPGAPLIEAWIRQSDAFLVTGEEVRFPGTLSELTDIELDLVKIMAGQGPMKSQEISAALEARGHGVPNIQKHIFSSPLVFADRQLGRGHYRFTLIKDLEPTTAEDVGPSEYDLVRQKLQELASTDIPSETKARAEQRILSRWLFRDRTECDCALCGRSFSISGLVTAHKKKRSICSETERRDPYIVFPLCKFGCDHLYEHGFVTVREGVVASGRDVAGKTETAFVATLLGRKVEPRWTAGPASYFDNVPGIFAMASPSKTEGDIAAQ